MSARPASRRRHDDARRRLLAQITSCWRTQALRVAVQLDLPDRLAGGPCDAAGLASACNCPADALLRLLRALCALGVCSQRRDGRFVLTRAGASLCREPADDGPGLRAMVLWWGGPMWSLWDDLDYSVQTGLSARARRTGNAHYGFLDGRPDEAALFHEAMRAMTSLVAGDVAALPCWRSARELVDVGGGHGELAMALAAAHPALHAIVFDRLDAEPGARALLARCAVPGRLRFAAGDFFAAVPAGADRYLLKSILHNWDDEACGRILARCAEAAPAGARLLLVERLRPERLRPTRHDEALARTDLNMLAGLGGRERSLAEFGALLAPAGFEISGVSTTRCEFSVVEARRR
ncbi:MAG: methyltransferase [Piscinibacter sp.]